ncbi:hypothetical protein Pcinc_007955 [Petrolisthes cinctipes]|nr:hypothetical protein Pcinc_014703 [Petrolisthes cinctipes]KAK3887996.1 hypothetical protein Pcinc_007955 [Petrolisthes cinctipes]
MEESEDDGELVHDIRKEEDYAIEGGSEYYNNPEILKNGQKSEDVIGEFPDEFSDSPSPLLKKRRHVMVESDADDENEDDDEFWDKEIAEKIIIYPPCNNVRCEPS